MTNILTRKQFIKTAILHITFHGNRYVFIGWYIPYLTNSAQKSKVSRTDDC